MATDSHVAMTIFCWQKIFGEKIAAEKLRIENEPDGPIVDYEEKFPFTALIDKFCHKSPDAIDFLLAFDEDNQIEGFQEDEMVEVLRRELGLAITNDAECLACLERFKGYAKDDPTILACIDHIIAFVNLPKDEDISDDNYPMEEMQELLVWSKVELDQLTQCALYLRSLVEEDSDEEDEEEGEKETPQ